MKELTEIWKPIDGYENYEVSNLGRVRTIPQDIEVTSRGTTFIRHRDSKIKKLTINPQTKVQQVILMGNGKYRTFNVHRLVAEAFMTDTKGDMKYITHIDNDYTNNAVTNLKWIEKPVKKGTNAKADDKPKLYKSFYHIKQMLLNGAVIASYVITCKEDWARLEVFGFHQWGITKAAKGESKAFLPNYYKGYLWEVDRILSDNKTKEEEK